MSIQDLPIESLKPNDWNPNVVETEDKKRMVARFLEKKAVDKPLTVRQVSDGVYQILDGEQTWSAAKTANFSSVPCMVVDVDDTEAMATTFVKNLHGKMNALTVGRNVLRMKKLAETAGKPLSNEAVAKLMSKSEGTVRNYLFYTEAAEWCGKVEGYPTEAELAKMQVKEVRALVESMLAGGGSFAKQPPLPLHNDEGQPIADVMADDEAALKAFDKAMKAIKALELEQLRKIKNEVNRLLREATKPDVVQAEAA